MNHVIAIAAPIGGGKTSLARAVAEGLGDAALLFHDHYEEATRRPVEELRGWLDEGADFNAFHLPGLAEDLNALKKGRAVIDPCTRLEIRPAAYIVFEMPLGRAYAQTAGLIDVLLWIDVPLDIALARRIKEYTDGLVEEKAFGPLRQGLLFIDRYIENYLRIVGEVLAVQRERVRSSADIVVDGRRPVGEAAEEAVRKIFAKDVIALRSGGRTQTE